VRGYFLLLQDAEVSHWEAMLSHPNEWVEQWHILRPDADFRDVTKSNNDTPKASSSSSYDVTRGSPEDDGDDDDDKISQEKDIGPEPVEVFAGEEPVAAINQGFQPGHAATFPRQAENKVVVDVDEYQFRAPTMEVNQGDESLKMTGVKKVSTHMLYEIM